MFNTFEWLLINSYLIIYAEMYAFIMHSLFIYYGVNSGICKNFNDDNFSKLEILKIISEEISDKFSKSFFTTVHQLNSVIVNLFIF